jgi:hypothetical protein
MRCTFYRLAARSVSDVVDGILPSSIASCLIVMKWAAEATLYAITKDRICRRRAATRLSAFS